LHYWRGITEALSHNGIEVIVAAVPPSGSIEARAAKLMESIAQKAKGKQVNIIAYDHDRGRLTHSRHSMVRSRESSEHITY
jgi:hypothetical protein